MSVLFRGFIFIIFFSLYLYVEGSSRLSPVVNTTVGLIQGLRAEDGDYYMYLGIPYGQVNRTNPFGAALLQEPFDEIFKAIDDTLVCPQVLGVLEVDHLVPTLDCLHLNIYVPTTASTDNTKPVMVFLHGGSFVFGFGGRYMYGPKFIIRHDVILVTVNYRLGPYGFLCLDIPEIPGNQGFKDQTLAFRWIHENIQAFGGDPNKITAFGNSAGGRSIDLHLVTQEEKFFNQAIIQSGSSVRPLFLTPNKNALFQLASYFGFHTDDIYEAIAILAEIDEKSLIAASSSFGWSFGPCVEKQFEGVEGFLTDNWVKLPMPKVYEMPIMIGYMDDETLSAIRNEAFFHNDMVRNNLNSGFDINHPEFEGMDQLVYQFYMGDEDITLQNPFQAIDFYSDLMFNHANYRSIARYLDNKAGDIYFYLFSYVGQRNYIRNNLNITVGGAIHADELGYQFDFSFYGPPNEEDQLFIDRMSTLWTNFAKYGNPTTETSTLLPVIWEPIRNGSAYYYLDLNSDLTLGDRPMNERMTFWDLFYSANYNLQRYPGN